MTPPPSSAATSLCDAAAILPSSYRAPARRPTASRLYLATARASYLTLHRRVLPIVLPLPFRCYRAAVASPGGFPARPSRSTIIASYRDLPSRRASPCLLLSRSAVAPCLALLSRQKSFWCCPALLGRRPVCCHRPAVILLLAQPSRHPAIALLPSARRPPFRPCHQVPPRPAALPLRLCPALVDLPCCVDPYSICVDSYSIVADSSSRLLISTWPSLPPCRQLLRSLSLLSRWGCPGNPGSTLL